VVKTVVFCVAMLCCAARGAFAAADPATTFARNCSSCHTFGRGVLVGPDLKGVADRHDRRWLAAWISSSETVIASGDRTAIALFDKFNKQRMPDQRLSPDEVTALIDYLAAGGPELDARRRGRSAEEATPAEIDMGRALFAGERAFARGGASCASCHRAADEPAGGTLGPDLSRSYARFHDKGLSTILSRGCFPRKPDTSARGLTDQEAFALRAYLRHTAAIGQ
jgi:mono/diheme cytochrome c family protein